MFRYLKTHPALAWTGVGLGLVGVAFVLVWFQPQKLLIEETAAEPVPRADPATGSGTGDETASPSTAPTTLAAGRFRSLEHETTGSASVLQLSDGRRFLRLSDLSTSNGPDLRVYLSEVPASDDWFAYGERYVDLGALKANRGDQNYELPEGLDLDRFKSAVIWCRRFTVGFGVAPLA